ncbi:hypothetical protein C8R43DRAFT_1015050 [Mycena crocata]|nr:hypothetical protein C8R43DRAFT_1015050 [Mycena crocata]
MPLGTWHADPAMQELGGAFSNVFLRYVASVSPMLIESGAVPAEDVEDMYERVEREVRTVAGLVSVLYTVHARKI